MESFLQGNVNFLFVSGDRGLPVRTARYSSGSTGRPKGVVHRHRDMVATSELYGVGTLGLDEGDSCYSAAKLFFAYGLGNALTFPMAVGATTVLMAERPTPQAVFARLRKHQPTIFYGVPTLFAALLASPELPERSELRLRRCTSAGEALPAEVEREKFLREYLERIRNAYPPRSDGRVLFPFLRLFVVAYKVA